MKIKVFCISLVLVVSIFLSLVEPTNGWDRYPGDGNETFQTAQEIPADGSKYSDKVNADVDLIDIIKFYIKPNTGECVNTTVNVNTTTVGAMIFVGLYTPDTFFFHMSGVMGGGPDMNYSFWAPSEGYYYIWLVTSESLDVNYRVSVTTKDQIHAPDGNNLLNEANEISPGNIYRERVNKTTDLYDIYKVYVNSNDLSSDGLHVHLDSFTDVNLAVYDPIKYRRGESNTIMSSDPDKGETVRFVANQTGYYYIMITFESFLPQGEYAGYNLSVEINPQQPNDEDWSIWNANPASLGFYTGSFESPFDEYDYFSIELHKDDDLNVSVMVSETDDWDVDITLYDKWEEPMKFDQYGGNDYSYVESRIPEDGTYYIEFQNRDWMTLNYTYYITTDGKNYENTPPMSLNESFLALTMNEDEIDSTSLCLFDYFNRGDPKSYWSPSHDEGVHNLSVDIKPMGTVVLEPVKDWFGNETVVFRARDHFNFIMDLIVNVSVLPINDPPQIISVDGINYSEPILIEVMEDQWKNFTINVTDIDDPPNNINYSIVEGSTNLHYNSINRSFSYFNSGNGSEIDNFTIKVTDGIGNVFTDISFIIKFLNDPPVPSPINLTRLDNENLTVHLETMEAYDEEGDVLIYKWSFGDGVYRRGLSLFAVNHRYKASGSYVVQLIVNDSVYSTSTTLIVNLTGTDYDDDDGDGVPDIEDDFPLDPSASLDSDSDGYPDEWNSGKSEGDSNSGLTLDVFPSNFLYHWDSDEDGMADAWEKIYGFDPLDPLDAMKDNDDDSISNLDEFLNGTNPISNIYESEKEDGSDGNFIWTDAKEAYTDPERDDVLWHWSLISLQQAEMKSISYGENGCLDLVDLKGWSNETHLHVELTTREQPVLEKEMDLSDLDMDIYAPSYVYRIYFLSPGHIEPAYGKDSDYNSLYTPASEMGLSLEYGGLFNQFGIYDSKVEGNTISWEISLNTLKLLGFNESSRFGLFGTAEYSKINPDNTITNGYDSIGVGAYSFEVVPESVVDTPKEPDGIGSYMLWCGVALIVLIMILVIVVVLIIVKRNGKKRGNVEEVTVNVSPEEEVRALIESGREYGIDVSGFTIDLDNALKYLEDDPYSLKNNLHNLSMRIELEIRKKKEAGGR